MIKYLIVLGGGVMQKPIIDICKSINIECIVFDKNPQCLLAEEVKYFENTDISNEVSVFKSAKKYKQKNMLDGIMTVGTDFSTSVAYAADNLSLPSIGYEVAKNCSVKTLMRQIFKQNNISCPNFKKISNFDDLNNINLQFPLVIKPADSMGGRGSKLVWNQKELTEQYSTAASFSKSNQVIVEEYANPDDYDEYSVDCIVYDNEIYIKGLAIRHIKYPPYFIEIGHTMPCVLDEEDYNILIDEFKRAIRALGINNGCAKGDIFYSKKYKKPLIGEIASRLSGGFMSGWTYPYSSGDSCIKNAIELALGKRPVVKKNTKHYTCCERAIISIDGKVKNIKNNNSLKILSNDYFLHLGVQKGSFVNFPKNNVQKCGNFIFAYQDRNYAIEFCHEYISNIFINLDNNHNLTVEYMTKNNSSPLAYPELEFEFKLNKNFENEVFENKICLPKNFLDIQDTKDWSYRSLLKTINTTRELYGTGFYEKEITNYDRVFWLFVRKAGMQGVNFFFEEFHHDPIKYFNILLGEGNA